MVVTFVVNTTNEKSGTGRLFVSLAREIEGHGHTVLFATEHTSDIPFTQTVVSTSRGAFGKIFAVCKVISQLRKLAKKSDVLIAVDVRPYGILALIATFGLRTPLILHAVGTYSLFTGGYIQDFLMGCTFKYADEIFVLNEFTKSSIMHSHTSRTYQFESKCTVAPVGVDVDVFSPQTEISNLAPRPYILSVGPLKQRKGYHLSVPAFAKISKEYPDLTYCIVTASQKDDDYTRSINSLINKFEISSRIIFCNAVSDIQLQKLYSHAEFHILTSVTTPEAIEAFGMVYAEAALCGVTSIGCLNTGAEIAIQDRETGLLAEPTVDSIALQMRILLDNFELRATLGRNAQSLAKSLTWKAAARPYILYLAKRQ